MYVMAEILANGYGKTSLIQSAVDQKMWLEIIM
jgi:hypothetical protein